MTSKTKFQMPEPECPAMIHYDHVQDRVISFAAGSPRAWRRLTVLEKTFAKGQLAGGSPRYRAKQRLVAGITYAEIFLLAESSGRDSTQALNVSRSSGGMPIAQSQHDAMRHRAKLDGLMSVRDGAIIRMVCGENKWPSEAVRAVCGSDYRLAIIPRFREALDALIEAFEKAKEARKAA